MESVEELLLLTPKGKDALSSAGSTLDPKLKYILALIARGANSVEQLLQRARVSRDEVTESLRLVARDGFVAMATIPSAKAQGGKTSLPGKVDDRQVLKPGISPSQARYLLSNFCLDHFGTEAQDMAEVIDLCTDVPGLQRAVNDIRARVDQRCPDRLDALIACLKEINETDF